MITLAKLLTGGLLYSGIRARRQRTRNRIFQLKRKVPGDSGAADETLAVLANSGYENYPIASATLGFTIAGRVLYAPLTFVGLAGMLYLLWSTFERAYDDLTRRKRFTSIVTRSLDLTGNDPRRRISRCCRRLLVLVLRKWKANKNLANVFVAPSSQAVYVLRDGVET